SAKNTSEGWESERNRAKFYAGGILECIMGVTESKLDSAVSLYPNPATNEVFIGISNKSFNNFDVTVVNSLGQILERKTNIENTAQTAVNVSNYAAGIYFITIKAGENVTTKKLVVQ